MNNTLRTRLLSILFIFGLGIYALFPSIKYQLLSDDAKNNLSKDELAYFESKSIKQGLDLKGGIYIVLEVDLPQLVNTLAKNKDKKFDRFLTELNQEYKNNSADFFTLFEQKASQQDLKLPRYFISYGKTKDQIIEQLSLQSTDSINRIIEIIQNRVDQFGVSEPTIQKQGNNRVVVELAGIQDSERARELLQSTALLELMIVKDVENTNTIVRQIDGIVSVNIEESKDNVDQLFSADTDEGNNLGFSSLLIAVGSDLAISSDNIPTLKNILSQENVQQVLDATGSLFLTSNSPVTLINDFGEEEEVYLLYHLVDNAELTGGVIEDAQMRLSQSGVSAGQATVQVEMNNEGSREWARITGVNVNKRIAIVLDKKVHMAPVIRSQIFGGATVIEGMDSIQEAEDIAIVLRAGALPVPVTIVDQRVVGPSLGADSVSAGTSSIMIGLLLIVLFIIFYYRASGFIASFSLMWTLILLLGVLALLEATLTLPGIAALILTVGMSVDANVIIFERIKEELRNGKSVRSAIDSGYERAITTIVDANLTTGIAAAVLYQYGSGPIKGFATVLFWGIIVSMFTAIIVTRFVFDFITSRKNIEKLSI
ncbi:MAG: protein translocase subunit SecD [Candidatus Neomarinimicrobiota bacterium]|nr:protein translocase subunit SecD [Candidatus Neomarinimicrobiota bacterium]|tara:strand:- start:2949 stop:4742 length:1794 start_codon:yes stop_codon:yes gene_type:complete